MRRIDRAAARQPWRTGRLAAALCALLLLAACGQGGGTTAAGTPSATAHPTPAVPLSAALDGVTVYAATFVAATSGNLVALNARSGATRWSFRAGGMYGVPAPAGGLIYIAPQDGYVYALDAASGKQVWQFKRDEPVDGYPAVAGGIVYVPSDQGTLYALGASDGAQRWAFNAPDPKDHMYAAPAVAGGLVYVGTGGTTDLFYALDAATGAERWHAHAAGGFDGVPAVADGVVYVGANDDALHAYRASDGTSLWSAPT
jgi:glucose dehydrogenase